MSLQIHGVQEEKLSVSLWLNSLYPSLSHFSPGVFPGFVKTLVDQLETVAFGNLLLVTGSGCVENEPVNSQSQIQNLAKKGYEND